MSFAVHKIAKLSPNPGKVRFEDLVNLLMYIRYNNTLRLNYYGDINDAPLSCLLRQANIKTENQLMDLYYSSCQNIQTLAEVQEHILYLIKVGQLTMSHMLQDQLLDQVQKVSTIQHALQE